jgi:hypothetical protein
MDGMHPLLRSSLGLFREAIAPVSESIWWAQDEGLYWCNSREGTIHRSALGASMTLLCACPRFSRRSRQPRMVS